MKRVFSLWCSWNSYVMVHPLWPCTGVSILPKVYRKHCSHISKENGELWMSRIRVHLMSLVNIKQWSIFLVWEFGSAMLYALLVCFTTVCSSLVHLAVKGPLPAECGGAAKPCQCCRGRCGSSMDPLKACHWCGGGHGGTEHKVGPGEVI